MPSLPGYGFSTLPHAGFSNLEIAGVMADLMSLLSYDTFGVQGGNYIPSGFHGDGTYAVTTGSDGTKTLVLRGLSFGRSRMETTPMTDCGAVFVSAR